MARLHGFDGVGPLGLGESAHVRIGAGIVEKGVEPRKVIGRRPVGADGFDDRVEVRQFPRQGHEDVRSRASRQRVGDVGMARQDGVEPLRRQGRGKGHAAIPWRSA